MKSGTQSGEKVKLKGKGIKKINTIGKGNMYIIYKVIIPEKITMHQKKLFKDLAETKLDDHTEFKEFKRYL